MSGGRVARARKAKAVLTENEAEGVTEGRLAPDQAPRVDRLGGAVDVTAADPGRRHREYPDEETDRAAGQHHLLLRIVAGFLLPGRPYSHTQDQQVKEDDRDHPGDVDHLRGVEVHRLELELTETYVRDVRRLIRCRIGRMPEDSEILSLGHPRGFHLRFEGKICVRLCATYVFLFD